ncbi:MAG: acylneuraminate cytidylyltransferase family protein [Acidimicrobiales bacterium]|nr:acylneuraminate cytidylyltransferase family protein [Acidimicrobiales bacterium]
MEVLAIVPARAGSKGLPGKNIVPFLGRPLIAWSIEAGLRAAQVDRVVVSTDGPEIAEAARRAGAEVPFERPPELGLDHVRDLPVFEHALEWLRANEGYVPDLVVQLRPTSPIRPDGLIDEAIDRLVARPDADSIRAVCLSQYPPYKMWRIEDDTLVPLLDSGVPEQHDAPRQALPVTYLQSGLLDVIRTATITEQHSMSGRRILPLVLDPTLDADIDDQRSLDWAVERARAMGYDEAAPGDPDR